MTSMTTTQTPAEIESQARSILIEDQARKVLTELTLDGLLRAFEGTIDNHDPVIPTVRGWIMDELEARNTNAFARWLDSTEDSPRTFFAPAS